MTEGRGGVWSYTTGVLEPELYLYNFYVDEMRYLDPANSYICRDIATWTNYFIISKEPGDKGSLYLASEVPHGTVTRVWYDSPTLKMNRRMTVYTPAGYEDSKEKYPVLYLCHGAGGDEEAWVTLGRTAQIMDNLIAAGLAKKMIVVMPNGNTHCEAAPGEWGAGLYRPSGSGANPMIAKGEASMDESFPDIVNYIENHYRVLKGKDNRAM